MSTLVEVTDGNFNTEVLGANVTVLVDFWARGVSRRMQTPILEGLAKELNGTPGS